MTPPSRLSMKVARQTPPKGTKLERWRSIQVQAGMFSFPQRARYSAHRKSAKGPVNSHPSSTATHLALRSVARFRHQPIDHGLETQQETQTNNVFPPPPGSTSAGSSAASTTQRAMVPAGHKHYAASDGAGRPLRHDKIQEEEKPPDKREVSAR